MRNPFVGNIRPALLLMLLSAAGLGVPGAFAQTAAKGPSKKKPTHGSAATSSSSPRVKSSLKTSGKTSATHKATEASASHAASSRGAAGHSPATRGASKKTSSKRSRRQPGQKAPTSDRVIEIQSALAKDGSFSGEPNGKWDDATSDAMRRFQVAHHLNPTGKLDALTLQKLGLGSQIAGVAAPTPPPGAVSRLTSSNSLATTESARRQ